MTFRRINQCLRPGGVLVFSWSHPMHKCTDYENGRWVFVNSYFDESVYEADIYGSSAMMSNRMMGTWVNALSRNGFIIERLVEESDIENTGSRDAFAKKAGMIPTAFVIRATKRTDS